MKEDVQLLIDLQELDQVIIKGRNQQKKLRAEQEILNAQATKLTTLIEQLDKELDAIKQDRGEVNQSLLLEMDNVEKAESRLPEIKTQKEYLAILKEVDIAKKQCKDLQDQLDGSEQAFVTLEEDRAEKQEQLDELKQSNTSRASEIDAELKSIDNSLKSEDKKRAGLAEKVPAHIRKNYELLLVRRKGSAMVEARKGNCLGCNMHLPPQFFNSMLKKQGIDSCPHCNRLLFVRPMEG